jgi:predicted  nucleic acid-binding Zn-ribbon protein
LNKDTLVTIGKVLERFGIYIAVGVFVFFAFNGWKDMGRRADLLEQRNIMFEQRMKEWTEQIGKIVEAQEKITKQVDEKKAQEIQIKMNVGKEIKEFNNKVKEIKKIEDPQESINALMRAWDAD